jgi:hypothetical protein
LAALKLKEESKRETTTYDISYIGEETLAPQDPYVPGSLRKALAMASAKFTGEIQEVTLELSTLGAKTVDRLNGIELQTDPIESIKLMDVIKDAEGHGARFQTEFCTRGCHWIPHIFACSDPMHVTNGIPLGCPLLLPVGTVNCVQTLKVRCLGVHHRGSTRICEDVPAVPFVSVGPYW